jgi:hypothetical protein
MRLKTQSSGGVSFAGGTTGAFKRAKGTPPFADAYYPVVSRKSSAPIYTVGGKVAGVYDTEACVFRKRCRNEHLLRRPPAVCVDESVLEELVRLGCRVIEVELVEQNRRLRASIDAFYTHGFRFNRGYGEQVGLPLRYWGTESSQLDLFAGKEDAANDCVSEVVNL